MTENTVLCQLLLTSEAELSPILMSQSSQLKFVLSCIQMLTFCKSNRGLSKSYYWWEKDRTERKINNWRNIEISHKSRNLIQKNARILKECLQILRSFQHLVSQAFRVSYMAIYISYVSTINFIGNILKVLEAPGFTFGAF